ncbi:CIC family chloride channel protein [Pedobacter cryoconitis]|uniref:CIC family chloride channel protein n=1 Tax=Pedobacter cryoconitis TaxID=188932 RepID=A0A7W8YRG9_9SPHI|nr:chloride channel protein [Pedobacter cryoconitis]MBB5620420.1 CIC family chloride channel protein [Pedobacter cryoconitis]MBB5646511.1 CIC family chloride channel protein [Pedobacter cryoconitis]
MYVRLVNYLDAVNQYRRTKISNRNFLVIAAMIVGVLAGLAAALLKTITHHIEDFLQDGFHWQYKYYLFLVFPFIGILLSVMYVRRFIRKGKFETGLTPLLYTISKKSSRVEPHNIYSQIITAALTVGFGGSTGLEAPIVTSGGGIGSVVGRFLGLSYRETTMLLACGAAAGIAGAFNSPIAGIVFAIEILLPEFTIPAFIPLLLSSATAAVVARFFYNEQLFFLVTEGWKFNSLAWYVVLAVLIGLFSMYFTKANYFIKGLFYKIKHPYQKVVVGGIVLGAMVFLFPTLYGEGYVTIKNLLGGNYTAVITNSIFSAYSNIPTVVILFTAITVFAKSAATLVTLGAGGNGGIFAPSLIMGGLIGFLLAFTINTLGIAHVNVSNFIVAGMAASLSAIMHAPLTGIFLIAEITGGYVLMVPLMITSAISYLINRSTNKYSIYTKPLAESGELMSHEDKDTTVLHMMKLKYLVEKDYLVLNEEETIAEKLPEILQSKRNIFPVIAEDKSFKGLIYVEDVLKKAINNPANPDLTVHDLMQTAPSIVFITDSMKIVLKKMEKENAWLLPVLNEQEEYIGFVSKTAVFNKYRALLSRQADYME